MNKHLDFLEQSSLFAPLQGLRVCLAGDFKMPVRVLNKRLRAAGVMNIDRAGVNTNKGTTPPPAKESTNLFVVGSNAPVESLNRYDINCHDGFCAVKITEDELYAILDGTLSIDIPKTIQKHINLDYSYYEWIAPKVKDVDLNRKSSPMVYDLESVISPVYGLEIFVPEYPGFPTGVMRQLIGNFGGYANAQLYDNTSLIMVSDETVDNMQNRVKDEVISYIEKEYEHSSSKSFDMQFTCYSDFLAWVHTRLEKCPDPSSQKLYDRLIKCIK